MKLKSFITKFHRKNEHKNLPCTNITVAKWDTYDCGRWLSKILINSDLLGRGAGVFHNYATYMIMSLD